MSSRPPTTINCRNADYTYHSTLTAAIHLYTDQEGIAVVVKRVSRKEADTHRQIQTTRDSSVILLLDSQSVSPSMTIDVWLVLERANSETLRELLAHARANVCITPVKIPGAFCFHILAGILGAVIGLQETYGVQHIDLHAGNVVFHMPGGGWPPLVQVIDFGKVVQLAEEGDEKDDVTWDEILSPSISPLVRSLMAQADVLEDEFLRVITPLMASRGTSVAALKTARTDALARAEAVSENVPQWLSQYFTDQSIAPLARGMNNNSGLGSNASPEGIDRSNSQAGYGDSGLDDMPIRLRIRVV